MVAPLSYASLAAGADGLLIESHPSPDKALSDKDQQITPEQLREIKTNITQLANYFDRNII